MKTKLLWIIGSVFSATLLVFIFNTSEIKNTDSSVEELRKKHASILKNSPFKETIKLTKKERKAQGLPPSRYFEQMWELSVNPSTGQLDDGDLVSIQNQIKENRNTQNITFSTPGESGNSWNERGPNDVGGRTRVMLFDPNDSSNRRVFAGGVSGGLWVNNDITSASSSWSRIQNVPGNLSVSSITVDPRNSNIWYVGTGEQYTAGDVVGNGVYRSTDGGNSWSALNIPPAGPASFDFNTANLFLSGIFYVNDIIAWDNGTSTELFVAVGAHVYGDASDPANWLGLQTAGIYRSTNGGTSWNRVESANMQFDFSGETYQFIPNDFEVGADNRLWVGTITTPGIGGGGGGRVFSTTNGSTWTEASGSPLPDSNRVELAVSSSDANKLYALTQGSGSTPVHVYSTTNAFNTVTTAALPNDADNGISANDFTRGQAFYDLMIEVNPSNDNILYVGGIDLFRSTNSASSWTQISKWSNNPGLAGLPVPLVHADQHAMTFRPGNSNQAVFGNDGGIFYASSLSGASNSGSAIGVRNNNYNVTQYVKAGIGPNGPGDLAGIFTAGAQDNGSQAFRNTTAGINGSEELSDGDGFYTFVDKDGQFMIATFVNNVIYRFNLPWDGRGRRQGGSTTLSSDQSRGDFVNPMDYDSDANRLLSNNSNRTENAILSINVAANNRGSLTNGALTDSPTAFRASPFANNVWHVGLADGNLVRLSNVTNTSATFTSITTPFVGSVSSVRYGATANDLMVTIHNYGVISVWSSSDGGATWDNKEGDLPNLPVRDILQNPLSRNEVIVATQMGVWTTNNFDSASPNWVQAFNGMSDASVTSFDYWARGGNDNNNIIIASTYGRGVFTGSFTTTAVLDLQAPSRPTNLVASGETQTTVNLNWDASTDNVGVTDYDVRQDGVVVATVAGTNYQVTGLTADTSYEFRVRANDAAGNQSTNSNAANVTTQSAPTSSGCSGGINTFPYSEGFEAGLGGWTQSTADNLDWTRDANGTPSSGTGPASAIEGSFYMYVEASGQGSGFPNMRAILTSPCFDLSNSSQATFTFRNHMFGSDDFGSIDLEISDDNGTTWTSIWNRTGNRSNQWNTENIDLSSYAGSNVQLRFNRVTGGIWQADFALDDISLTDGSTPPPPPSNCTGPSISSFPYTETFNGGIGLWTQDASDDGNWTLDANGTPSNNTGPSADFSGNSNYFFTEASTNRDPGPNATVNLLSPCFDLTGSTSANFIFNYHMFGSNTGSLRLDVSTDNGVTWSTQTSLVGQQQGSSGAPWLSRTVNLNAFTGQFIRLRLSATTGNRFRSDIAIDQLSLTISNNASREEDNDIVLGLDLKDVILYPNPVSGNSLNVQSSFENLNYEVYNIIGQVVAKGNITNTNTIDISNLNSAVYHIKFNSGEQTIMKRFIKR